MVKFGTAGNSESFYNEGNKSSIQTPKFLANRGLDVLEYSFGRGVKITESVACAVGEQAKLHNIEISAHAPYYINLASPDGEKIIKSYGYLLSTLSALKSFGGNRCIVHLGSESKQHRNIALKNISENLRKFIDIKNENGYEDMILAIETMGKYSQIGSLEEIVDYCQISDCIYPCLDFGHLNCREQGNLATKHDFSKILTYLVDNLPENKAKCFHSHFSKIEYGKCGEVRHLTFEDNIFGPNYEPFLEALFDSRLEPIIISESAGTQAEDAWTMKNYFCLLK